jgi:hypothetical protein
MLRNLGIKKPSGDSTQRSAARPPKTARKPKMTDAVIFVDDEGHAHAAVVTAVKITVALNEAEDDLVDSYETVDVFVFDSSAKISCVPRGTIMSDGSFPRQSWHWPE